MIDIIMCRLQMAVINEDLDEIKKIQAEVNELLESRKKESENKK